MDFHWRMLNFSGAPLLGNTESFSSSAASNGQLFLGWGGISCLTPSPGFGLACAYTGLVLAVSTTVSSFVRRPCCHQKIPLPYSNRSLLARSLLPVLFQWSQVCGGEDTVYMFPLGLNILNFLVFCPMASCGSLLKVHLCLFQLQSYLSITFLLDWCELYSLSFNDTRSPFLRPQKRTISVFVVVEAEVSKCVPISTVFHAL